MPEWLEAALPGLALVPFLAWLFVEERKSEEQWRAWKKEWDAHQAEQERLWKQIRGEK